MSEKSLEEKILADLDKSGFGSEMRALKVYLSRKWSATGSRSFEDQDESKTREIDLVAHRLLRLRPDDEVLAEVFFEIVAEVKKASKPWIIFKQPSAQSHELGIGWSNVVFTDRIPDVTGAGGFRTKPRDMADSLSSGLASRLKWIGSGIHEAFKPPEASSRWYGAMVTACKAAEHALKLNSWDTSDERNTDQNPYVFFIQPTVILDGLLYSAELDESANIQIAQIDAASVYFEFASQNYRRGRYHVNVVRLSALEDYIDICEDHHNAIFDALLTSCKIETSQNAT